MKCAIPIFALGLLLQTPSPRARGEDFSTQVMLATVKLNQDKTTAAGFLLTRPTNAGKRSYVLVTAGHVFNNMPGNEATVFFHRKESEGVYKKVPVRLPIRRLGKALWARHPSADVAAIAVTPPADCRIPDLPLDVLATDDALKANGVHPGDTVCCLGYPHSFEVNDAGFPVLRSGAITSYPLWPTKVIKTFFVSANTFEGDSGGAVYLAESNRTVPGKKQPQEARLILGLIVGQEFLDEETKMIYETSKIRHRLGLAIAVPASFIRETVDQVPPAP
jgi:hypothetical protein